MVELAATMSQVNNRQILIQHDREIFAAVGVRVEQADELTKKDPRAAAQAVAQAVLSAQALYGRDASLDSFLRRARKVPVVSLPEVELRQLVEEFRSLLAKAPIS